mgnify:CR=1 FL=1
MSKQIYDIQEDDSLLLNPQDIQKRRRIIVDQTEEDTEIIKEIERSENKYSNVGGKAVIELETMGRFGIPSVVYFSDFSTQDINDLALSRQEDLLKTLTTILSRCKSDNDKFNIEDMLLEDILEVLIGIKIEFNTTIHEHPWICDCQRGIESSAQIINRTEIDLKTLQYKSIKEADEDMRNYYADIFKQLTPEQFQDYLKIKYKNEPETDISKITVESEISSLKIIEPFGFRDEEGNIYSFRFTRLKDLLDAHKMVQYKYSSKIKAIKNKQAPANSNLADFKNQKESEIEEIQYQQAKDLILYSKAFTLVKYNGKNLSKEEAIGLYKKIPRSLLFRINNFFDQIKFGVNDEREMVCSACGETSRRLLRQEFNPFEFLPLDTDTVNPKTSVAGPNIFIGV